MPSISANNAEKRDSFRRACRSRISGMDYTSRSSVETRCSISGMADLRKGR
jgi:hypothetical protein